MKYNVPLLNQSVNPICYVVAAAMIQKYWQQTAGNDFDTPLLTGGFNPLTACIPGASSNRTVFNGLRNAGFISIDRPSSITKARIKTLLTNYGPLILNHRVANFNYGPTRGGKQASNAAGLHAVALTGIEGNNAFFNNPWGDKDVMVPASDLLTSIGQAYDYPLEALFYAAASPMPQNIIY
ncbi:papain-like cysteine protease family protein [Persicitalea jodogahamensis]|nr:papain-like cysteine protease family protein [Persicitalea jodogahamensis]